MTVDATVSETPGRFKRLSRTLALLGGVALVLAAEALVADGRRNLIELEDGMNAWEQDGRSLVDES